MIYFFHGDDTMKLLEKIRVLLADFKKKNPNAVFEKITDSSWKQETVQNFLGAQSFFADQSFVFFFFLADKEEAREFLIDNVKDLASSKNVFVWLETSLKAAEKKAVLKVAEKDEEINKIDKKNLSKKELLAIKGEKIDFFEYADAWAGGDKKRNWIMFVDAMNLGVPAEELHSIYFWQTRSMLAAVVSPSQSASGLKPYPYEKSLSAGRKMGEQKLRHLCNLLISVYHEAHRGKVDLYNALERIILTN
jgi:peptidyl-tRNA hydrolase